MFARPAFASVLLALSVVACSAEGPVSPPTAPNQPGGGPGTGPSEPTGPSLTYRYGAKFEPPIGRVVHGLGQWQEYNVKHAAMLPADKQPASELLFILLTDTVRTWNPALISARLSAIDGAGRIPLADLSLRGNQPTPAELAAMSDKLYASDAEIAHSAKWDSRIADVANLLKAYKKPVLLRIGGEFNGSWNGYHPWDYPLAFRKIVTRIRAAGADNVAFVWCYEPAAPGDFYEQNAAGAWKWYPGDDVVDWFSIDLFASGDVTPGAGGHGGGVTAYSRTVAFLDLAVAKSRPVVIAESSPSHFDVVADGLNAWNGWFAPYFALIAARPEISWFVYINYDWSKASYYANNGWKNNDISANPALVAQYVAEVSKAKYLHSTERSLLKDHDKYK